VINGLETDNDRVAEGDRLMRYGFREFENKTVVHKGQVVANADVWFGKDKTVPLVADTDVLVTLPVNAEASATFVLKYTGPLQAPVEQGAHVADLVVRIKDGGEQVIPLKAQQSVPKLSGVARMVAVLKHYLLHQD